MSTKDTSGPAFPCEWKNDSDMNLTAPNGEVVPRGESVILQGMTLRQYAAIKLKVPDSGLDWLDEMINKSRRDEFATKAMQGDVAGLSMHLHQYNCDELFVKAKAAYAMANAMLEARKS